MSKMYFIGNAHIDPVWLWNWQDGLSEILSTYKSALDRMKNFPDFKFTSACACYYQFIEKLDPDMFAEIQERVREGRWNIVGGWFLQPDCNIPCGESFARHGLISQRYFNKKFGITVKTGYNVDSFGHNAALPKILNASGMEHYVFLRPGTAEQGRDEYLFNWESDDGSSVTAYRIPVTYNCTSDYEFTTATELCNHFGHDAMIFYGVGNHGGGPTIALIQKIHKDYPSDVLSTPDEYFSSIDKSGLPVISGELQHHARGCYSAVSTVKRANRKCEQNLLAAEKFCVMANKLSDYKYPHTKLNKAWKNLMFNQFHDILCGCCIKSAYDDAGYLFGETMSITEQEISFALQKIALNIDTLQGDELPTPESISRNFKTWEHSCLGIPVIVFNPHTWSVTTCVSVNETARKVTDADGNEIPFQLIRGEQTNLNGDIYRTAFTVTLPPFGYATYRLYTKHEAQACIESDLIITENSLENSRVQIKFDSNTGDICSFFHKDHSEYIISSPCRAVLLDETACDTWAHNKTYLGDTVDSFSNAKFEIVENGPIRAILRSTVTCNSSTVRKDFILHSGSDRLVVNTRVNFHEKHRTLKFTFPMTDETVTAAIPYGTIKRCGYTGEEPCGHFIASGNLAVANDSKYGYDTDNQEFRLTVLRGAIYADHYGERDGKYEYMDMGVTDFTYSVFRHDSISDTEKKACELNFEPRIVMGSFHGGSLPLSMSCFEADSDRLLVSAIKKSEDGEKDVIRCFEADGEALCTEVKLFDKRINVLIPRNGITTLTEDGEKINLLEMPQ